MMYANECIKCEETLLDFISILKDELIEIGIEKGFNHHETIEASQKLDDIIVKYQKLKHFL
jgi:hypothetical protein